MGISGLGFRAWGLGCRVVGCFAVFKVYSVKGLGFWV